MARMSTEELEAKAREKLKRLRAGGWPVPRCRCAGCLGLVLAERLLGTETEDGAVALLRASVNLWQAVRHCKDCSDILCPSHAKIAGEIDIDSARFLARYEADLAEMLGDREEVE